MFMKGLNAISACLEVWGSGYNEWMLKLGVNIDHVATIRQARYRMEAGAIPEPDPVEAAKECVVAGAHSITAHLREDRRHIQDRDVELLKKVLEVPLNLEMAVTDEMVEVACGLKPEEACLVPEKREEVTTEGGLDVLGNQARVAKAVEVLHGAGVHVSLFIDPHEAQVKAAVDAGARCVELHTGAFANAAEGEELARELAKLKAAAELAHSMKLQVNAGHGLNYPNLKAFLVVPYLDTLNIGHSIVSRSVRVGIRQATAEMLALMEGYANG